ncbi:hypothetical protein CAP35_08160 [Chitinophagaceae bacterium IBVUCB1]|nr:hypothetical protein CAP35_08160 [Chitinophagaceae bacterium IBVUCB1]
MKKQLLIATGLVASLFTSCKKDDDTNVIPTENLKVPYSTLTSTTNYFETFKSADGKTTVDFSGQTTRINMLKEMDAYMKKGITSTITAAKLKDMYENKNSAFADASLNTATDKTIVSKTAQSFSTVDADAERQRFYGYFTKLEANSASYNQVAAQGKAGVLDGKYLVDEKGFEYPQFIQKGLIGAMMLDQISNIYLGTEKQAADNSNVVSGKNYTALEHHWDEAYGYLTSNEVFPKKDPADATKWLESYLGTYVRQVSTGVGGENAADVYMALLKGRAAIVNKDMTTRDAQIAYIRTSLEKAVAIIAISYINKTKTATSDAVRYHALSEGVGFIYSLRFAHNPKMNRVKSEELINSLMNKPNGFWSLTNADLDAVRDQLASAFGVSKDVVVNH